MLAKSVRVPRVVKNEALYVGLVSDSVVPKSSPLLTLFSSVPKKEIAVLDEHIGVVYVL
jgi:hypothetical protein